MLTTMMHSMARIVQHSREAKAEARAWFPAKHSAFAVLTVLDIKAKVALQSFAI